MVRVPWVLLMVCLLSSMYTADSDVMFEESNVEADPLK